MSTAYTHRGHLREAPGTCTQRSVHHAGNKRRGGQWPRDAHKHICAHDQSRHELWVRSGFRFMETFVILGHISWVSRDVAAEWGWRKQWGAGCATLSTTDTLSAGLSFTVTKFASTVLKKKKMRETPEWRRGSHYPQVQRERSLPWAVMKKKGNILYMSQARVLGQPGTTSHRFRHTQRWLYTNENDFSCLQIQSH